MDDTSFLLTEGHCEGVRVHVVHDFDKVVKSSDEVGHVVDVNGKCNSLPKPTINVVNM